MPSLPLLSAASSPLPSRTRPHTPTCVLPPSNPIVFFLSFSFFPSSLLPPCEDKIADYFVSLPAPRVGSNAALPATPPYSTHYATLDYTNFRLSLSVFVYLHPIPFSRLLSVSSCPSRRAVFLASTHVSFTIPFPPAPSSVSLARLHREMHDRHSGERITRTAFTQSTMLVPTV